MQTIKVGDCVEKIFSVSDGKVKVFAEISTDDNPLHLDDEYANKTLFKRRIAHGMLIGSFISAVIAKDLPGPGSIYLEQSLKFTRPVFIGSWVKVIVTVTEISVSNKITLLTEVYDHEGVVVLTGFALVKRVEHVVDKKS